MGTPESRLTEHSHYQWQRLKTTPATMEGNNLCCDTVLLSSSIFGPVGWAL